MSLRRVTQSGDLTNLYYLTRLPPCSFMVARLDRDWRTTVSSSDPESRLTNLSISTILLRSTFLLEEEGSAGVVLCPFLPHVLQVRGQAQPESHHHLLPPPLRVTDLQTVLEGDVVGPLVGDGGVGVVHHLGLFGVGEEDVLQVPLSPSPPPGHDSLHLPHTRTATSQAWPRTPQQSSAGSNSKFYESSDWSLSSLRQTIQNPPFCRRETSCP